MEDEMDEMMGEGEEGLSSLQIDLEYEYSAPRFYDFTGMETADDSREAEAWFDSAGSDPDSPYLAKLLHMREAIVDEESDLPQAHDVEHYDPIHHLPADSRPSMGTEINMMDEDRKVNMQGAFLMEQPADFHIMEKSADAPVGYIQNLSQHTSLDRLVMDCIVADSLKETESSKGIVSKSHNGQHAPQGKDKSFLTARFSRSSTLMKPTASQLAKQKKSVLNFPREVEVSRRIVGRPTLSAIAKNKKDAEKASFSECHASKRQKLEGGQLRKQMQQLHDMKERMPLLHKAPKQVQGQSSASCMGMHAAGLSNRCSSLVKDRHIDGIREQTKLRLTVPREPELKTAQRARRIRANMASNLDECELTKASLSKAQPLNRKVLEAPSLPLPQRSARRMPVFHEFHLKTSERALQHSLAVPSTVSCGNPGNVRNVPTAAGRSDPADTKPPHLDKIVSYPRSRVTDSTKPGINDKGHIFKARPLDRKIFSSKGDIGIYRNFKRETTKPVGFNFPTDKRFPQPNPPIDLFNKLSLKSEVCHHNASQTTLPHTSHSPLKIYEGEKENVNNLSQHEHNMVVCTGEEKEHMSQMPLNQTKEGGGMTGISNNDQLLGRSPFIEMLEVNVLSCHPSSNGSLLVAQSS
ncbi:protein TPX2-like [Nymphaea colorata]|nr:protein TPX2-like [Nymphaea colorata]